MPDQEPDSDPVFEYVCNECETILLPPEIGQHVDDHEQVCVIVTRREIYEHEHGPVEDGGE